MNLKVSECDIDFGRLADQTTDVLEDQWQRVFGKQHRHLQNDCDKPGEKMGILVDCSEKYYLDIKLFVDINTPSILYRD